MGKRERGRKGVGRKRERTLDLLFHLFMHSLAVSLVLVCALTGDRTCNLAIVRMML